jgi:hypothetical protein
MSKASLGARQQQMRLRMQTQTQTRKERGFQDEWQPSPTQPSNRTITLPDRRIGIVIESRKHGTKIAVVDAADYPAIAGYRWRLHVSKRSRTIYVQATARTAAGAKVHLFLHRLIASPTVSQVVDHKDSCGLHNFRSNLRVCTNAENIRNQQIRGGISQFKGVYWCKQNEMWRAQIGIDMRRKYLGYFASETDAARAYNSAATELHGAFARLNIIPGDEAAA